MKIFIAGESFSHIIERERFLKYYKNRLITYKVVSPGNLKLIKEIKGE